MARGGDECGPTPESDGLWLGSRPAHCGLLEWTPSVQDERDIMGSMVWLRRAVPLVVLAALVGVGVWWARIPKPVAVVVAEVDLVAVVAAAEVAEAVVHMVTVTAAATVTINSDFYWNV